jgi:hypothetical protein
VQGRRLRSAKAPAATEFHFPTPEERAALNAASGKERDRELKLLGITEMQKPATAYDIGKPGNANYDEAKANPYPKLPALLTMKDGRAVKTAAEWARRRKEIEALFAEDVYGKYPAHLPAGDVEGGQRGGDDGGRGGGAGEARYRARGQLGVSGNYGGHSCGRGDAGEHAGEEGAGDCGSGVAASVPFHA